MSLIEKAFGEAKSSILCFNHGFWKKKVLEWPHPLSLSGYFDGISGERLLSWKNRAPSWKKVKPSWKI